jgi:hypothetical protein
MEKKLNSVTGADGFTWDSKSELTEREGHVRDTTIYLTAGLLLWMEEQWGQMFQYVKTATNVETTEVLLVKSAKGEPDAVEVKRVGTGNSGYFSLLVPLRKMNVKVPEDRQFNIKPSIKPLAEGVGFVFDFKQRVSVPRNLKEDEDVKQGETQPAPPASGAAPGTEAAAAKQP